MSGLLELVHEQIRLRQERLAVMNRELETLERMRDDAISLNGSVSAPADEAPKAEPATAKRARRKVPGRPAVEGVEAWILERAGSNGRVKAKDVQDQFGIAQSSASYKLGRLARQGKVERHGEGRASYYTLPGAAETSAPKRARAPRQDPGLEGRLLEFLALPRTATEIVSNFEGVDVGALDRLLRVLRDEGNVEKTAEGRWRACK